MLSYLQVRRHPQSAGMGRHIRPRDAAERNGFDNAIFATLLFR